MDTRPSDQEYSAYHAGYVALVPETDVVPVLEAQIVELKHVFESVRPEREEYRYQPDKWTLRELAGHLVDAERVFAYRIFCLGRGEQAPLPSFDENEYVTRSPYVRTPLRELVAELVALRTANLMFLRRLGEAEWGHLGTASGKSASARGVAFVMAGHVRHHLKILRERYGVPPSA